MDFKEYKVIAHGNDFNPMLRNMVEKIHYKHTSRSMKQREVFSLWHEDLLVGCAVFGDICSSAGARKYGRDTLELRRFVLINEAPRNSESWFLGNCLRAIKKAGTYRQVLTYADPNKGHEGTIYKATNFKYIGVEQFRQQILRIGRRDVSMRQVYQKSKHTGNYVESAVKYQQMKRDGLAKVVFTKAKHIYIYNLKGEI
jgi:hypothetical protein